MRQPPAPRAVPGLSPRGGASSVMTGGTNGAIPRADRLTRVPETAW
jgi:hypothetical protein